MLNDKSSQSPAAQGKLTLIGLAALAIAAIGGIAYFTGAIGGSGEQTETAQVTANDGATQAVADVQPAAADAKADGVPASAENPVVAKVSGEDITRADVLAFIQTLSPQARQMPAEQLFPLATEQLVNAELIKQKLKGVNLENDPLVKAEMKVAKEQIVRSVFMQKEADKALTDDVLMKAYEEFKKNFPDIDEAKARHILVKDEAQANEIIKKLQAGGDFAALAKEFSIDGTKEKGGELNYFAKAEVVPEFGNAAFAMNVKEVSTKPVKSQFGYHIIEILDKRKRQPPTFEQAKPFLANQLRGQALNSVIAQWRNEAKVEMFDMNGNPLKPAAPKAEVPKAEEPKAEEKSGG